MKHSLIPGLTWTIRNVSMVKPQSWWAVGHTEPLSSCSYEPAWCQVWELMKSVQHHRTAKHFAQSTLKNYCVCVCVCSRCARACMCVHMWRPEVDFECLLSFLPTLLCETKVFHWTHWRASSRAGSSCLRPLTLVLGLLLCSATPGFYTGGWWGFELSSSYLYVGTSTELASPLYKILVVYKYSVYRP